MNPYVSVIMPSLNVADYIDECIKSVLSQTLENIEILCVDAGSSDGTYEKLVCYAKQDSRIRLITSDKKSYGYQVNLGLAMAKGEYVGIVETDDFIDVQMYESLYRIACDTQADIIKADYDEFVEYPDGSRQYNTWRLFKEEKNYNVVLCPQHMPYLYANDYFIWKGIYKRTCLLENEIWLNESKGAAYQDIGFTQLVHACAKTAYYSKQSFYRYRMDRETSSSNSGRGLGYSCQEFRRLIETPELYQKLVCTDGLLWHMAQSFEGEFVKIIKTVDFDMQSPLLEPYMKWFRPYLEQLLSKEDVWNEYNIYVRNSLTEILSEEYAERMRIYSQSIKRKKSLICFTKEKDVIVFGAGVRGERIFNFLQEQGCNVLAITDNNTRLWGTLRYGMNIYSPQECVNKYSDAVFVIANKVHSEEIKEQLQDMKISLERIMIGQL